MNERIACDVDANWDDMTKKLNYESLCSISVYWEKDRSKVSITIYNLFNDKKEDNFINLHFDLEELIQKILRNCFEDIE